MVTFLTGVITEIPAGWDRMCGIITEKNGFKDQLRKYWKQRSRCLFVTSYPDRAKENDMTLIFYREALNRSGFEASCFDLLDNRYKQDFTRERLASYDVIFLGSGRMPDQWKLLSEVKLRETIKGEGEGPVFDGLIMGISAGAMNCAEMTYNWPEEPGDTDPSFPLFYQGLGLTNTQILPHYQDRYEMSVDGRSLFYDITVKDSKGHEFLCLPDYSFVVVTEEEENIYGPYGYYRDGEIIPVK
ncbi:MAG: Type 1 glutamine amidotransferase-like domain-containing protein [Clostridiales bacterium]|nr:Type 1 glutamine amidotransferase-like domain-containing protein [Candidatus Blautia equi]